MLHCLQMDTHHLLIQGDEPCARQGSSHSGILGSLFCFEVPASWYD